eukprot:Nk52_evm1s521 gene=Nk52_evmTU1s521
MSVRELPKDIQASLQKALYEEQERQFVDSDTIEKPKKSSVTIEKITPIPFRCGTPGTEFLEEKYADRSEKETDSEADVDKKRDNFLGVALYELKFSGGARREIFVKGKTESVLEFCLDAFHESQEMTNNPIESDFTSTKSFREVEDMHVKEKAAFAMFRGRNASHCQPFIPVLIGSHYDDSRKEYINFYDRVAYEDLKESGIEMGWFSREETDVIIKDLTQILAAFYGRDGEAAVAEADATWGYPSSTQVNGLDKMQRVDACLSRRMIAYLAREMVGDLKQTNGNNNASEKVSRRGTGVSDPHTIACLHTIRRQLDTLSDWWPEYMDARKTLVHGDFTPRNMCLKHRPNKQSKRELLAYDWETTAIGLPQHDIVSFLSFTLDMSKPGASSELKHHMEVARCELNRLLAAQQASSSPSTPTTLHISKEQYKRGFITAAKDFVAGRGLLVLYFFQRFRSLNADYLYWFIVNAAEILRELEGDDDGEGLTVEEMYESLVDGVQQGEGCGVVFPQGRRCSVSVMSGDGNNDGDQQENIRPHCVS